MRHFLLLAVLALAAGGCSDGSGGPKVIVANHSSHTLSNVTLSGSGFTTSMGKIEPRSVQATVVHPAGESSLRVTFEVDGKTHDSGDCCYFENNSWYTVAVNVDPELKVAVLTNIGRY